MSFRDANWKILCARIPRRESDPLRAAPASDSLVLVPTPSGCPAGILDGVSLCSRHDPAADAARRVEREVREGDTAVVILGFGLGYEAEAVLKVSPRIPLLVVEADEGLFAKAMEARDLEAVLSSGSFSFLIGRDPQALTPVLDALPMKAVRIIRLRHTMGRDASFYAAAEGAIRSHALRREINDNTLNRFGRLWVRNLARNIPAFVSSPGIGSLEGLFSGIPALLLAGGPSFDEVRPHLGPLKERLLLVAVDTPLRACLESGVDPDFTVVVDPQYWTTRYLDWTGQSRSILVAEPSTHPRVLRTGRGRTFLVSSLFPLGEWLESRLGAKGKLGAGGSVSTTAWDLCRLLGAGPIHAAGLDLGFPGNRTHFRGSFFEQGWFADSGRMRPLETVSFQTVREAGNLRHPAYDGGTARTDKRMAVYRNWFTGQLAARPGLQAFNLSGRATVIPGMPRGSLEDLLLLPVRRPEIRERLERARSLLERGRDEGISAPMRDALEELTKELAGLERLAGEALDLTAALSRATGIGLPQQGALRRLDGIDREILGVSSRRIASFLLQATIREIEGLGESAADRGEALGAGRKLYESLRDSARFHREVLGAALARLPR